MLIEAVRLLLFPAIMAVAASTDLLTMKISNRIPMGLTLGFILLAAFDRMPLVEIGWHVGGGLAVLTVAFICFARGWIGGGDAKLAAATALWFNGGELYAYLMYASLLGGGLTLLLLEFRQLTLPARLASQAWLVRLHQPHEDVPYGIALAAAALLIYPSTVWMRSVGM